MIAKDLRDNVLARRAISPTRVTDNTAQESQIIDRQGYQSLLFVIASGTIADSDATVTALLEDGDDSALGDNAAVANDQLHGTEALAGLDAADDNAVRTLGYPGNKRYVRLTLTPADNTGNMDIAAIAMLGHPLAAPVTQSEN